MRQRLTDQQEIIRKVIEKFLEENKELLLRRITGISSLASGPGGIEIAAFLDKDINLNTSGAGKAKYNGVELNTGGGGGGSSGYVDRIIGTSCPASAQQPTVICSPPETPCEIHVIAGKNGRIVFKRSA